MDARVVAKAAGVEVGTLNSWIHRGLVPGMTTGARGRQRHFDLDTAVNVALIVELGRVGISAITASLIAKCDRAQHKKLAVVFSFFLAPGMLVNPDPNTQVWAGAVAAKKEVLPPLMILFDSEAELPESFAKEGIRPTAYVVIDVEEITSMMKAAQERWEQERAR